MSREPLAVSKRSWYRLHLSTWIVMTLVLGGLVLLIAPGELRQDWGWLQANMQHGWPWVYLERRTEVLVYPVGRAPWLIGVSWNWSVEDTLRSETNPSFSLLVLLADMGIAVAILFLFAAAFEVWRRRRKRVWQVHMSDIIVATLLVGLLLGWWHLYDRQHAWSQQALQTLSDGDPQKVNASFSAYAGPAWLHKVVGSGALPRQFESVAVIDWRITPAEIERNSALLQNLRNLRQLDVEMVGDADVQPLVVLKQLEFLILRKRPDMPVTDAALPSLAQMTNLRVLCITNPDITDQGIVQLCSLKRLERLDLGETARLTQRGVDKLRSYLPNCSIFVASELQP